MAKRKVKNNLGFEVILLAGLVTIICFVSFTDSWFKGENYKVGVQGKALSPVCNQCPALTPPSPNFCKNGKIVAGEVDSCGCRKQPKCISPTALPAR